MEANKTLKELGQALQQGLKAAGQEKRSETLHHYLFVYAVLADRQVEESDSQDITTSIQTAFQHFKQEEKEITDFVTVVDQPEAVSLPVGLLELVGFQESDLALQQAMLVLKENERKLMYFTAANHTPEQIVESLELPDLVAYWKMLESSRSHLVQKLGRLPSDQEFGTLHESLNSLLKEFMAISDQVDAFEASQSGASYGKFLIIVVTTCLLTGYLFVWPLLNKADGNKLFNNYYQQTDFPAFVADSVLPDNSRAVLSMSQEQVDEVLSWIQNEYETQEEITPAHLWLECLLNLKQESFTTARKQLKDLKRFDPLFYKERCKGLKWKIRMSFR